MSDAKNKPYDVFVTRQYQVGDGEVRTDFLKIGIAWPHKSGKGGFKLDLFAVPLSGDLVMLPPKPAKASEEAAA